MTVYVNTFNLINNLNYNDFILSSIGLIGCETINEMTAIGFEKG